MMQELHRLYTDIPVPPNLKDDILTYCRTAEERPKPFVVRYAKPLAALAACAAVLVVSLAATGNLFGGGGNGLPVGVPESTPEMSTPESVDSQVDEIPESASTTRGTMMTTTVRGMTTTRKCCTSTTTAHLEGTGGDQNACEEHYPEYHAIFSSVYQYFDDDADRVIRAFSDKYKGEDNNIVNFVKEYHIDKETFIRLNGFTEDDWDKPWEGTAIAGSIIVGEYVDAIYSDDPAKIDAVFKRKKTPTKSNEPTTTTTTDDSVSVSVPEPIRTTKQPQ